MKRSKGVTLFEMLLVLGIMSAIIVMIVGFMTQKSQEMVRDRAALQMQQILNAGLTFYLNTNPPAWPANVAALQPTYIPATFNNKNPWGNAYNFGVTTAPTFQVSTVAGNASEATILAGRLPLASAVGTTVTAMVSIPGQNLNNARSVNFGSLYHSGSCVPAPVCPQNMTPSILVTPVQAYGVYDAPQNCANPNDPTTCDPQNLYPVTGYTAFAIAASAVPNNCDGGPGNPCLAAPPATWLPAAPAGSNGYYRVCLVVQTQKGQVVPTGANSIAWGVSMGSVMAITRCVPAGGDPASSGFTVWAP